MKDYDTITVDDLIERLEEIRSCRGGLAEVYVYDASTKTDIAIKRSNVNCKHYGQSDEAPIRIEVCF